MEDDLEDVDKSPSAGDGQSSGSKGGESVVNKSGLSPRFLIILAGCSLLVSLLLVAIGLRFITSKRVAPPPVAAATVKYITTMVRPVPQPDNREMLDFILVYDVQGRAMITALRMEAGFRSLPRFKSFEKNPVLFRETVYNFLLQQNAADNTAQTWRSVFGQNLLDYLRVKLPDSCPDIIRMTQIENL
ncbi:MAG: hypothetical protein P4L55_23005 [Syntrophobacteraceae bacterium]|nr:hypothetical protein [Syntrophobacteraceae bacterium]